MIIFMFFGIVSIFLLSAFFAGNVGHFINIDSLIIVLLGSLLSAIAISWGRMFFLKKGIIEMLSFSKKNNKDSEVANIFSGLTISTITIGFCSTCQGIISGVLSSTEIPFLHILSFASFTTIYSLILSVFLFLPVVYRNK